MTNCFSRIQHYSYSWPFCYWGKIAFFFFTFYFISTLYIFLYFSILDRIIKYFSKHGISKESNKTSVCKEMFLSLIEGETKPLNDILFPMPVFITVAVFHPKCSQWWEGKLLSISGGTWLRDNCTDAVVYLYCFSIPYSKSKIVSHLPRNAFYFSII